MTSAWSFRRAHYLAALVCGGPLVVTCATGLIYRCARSRGAEKASMRWLMDLHTMATFGLAALYPLLLCALVVGLVASGLGLSCLGDCFRRGPPESAKKTRHSRDVSKGVAKFEAKRAGTNATSAVEESELSESSEGESGSGSDDSEWAAPHRVMPLPSADTWRQRLVDLIPRTLTKRWLHRTVGTAVFLPLLMTTTTGAAYIVARDWLGQEKSQYKWLMAFHEGRFVEATGTLYVLVLGASVLTLSGTGAWMILVRTAWWRSLFAAPAGAGRYSAVASNATSAASVDTLARIRSAFDVNDSRLDDTEDEAMGLSH